jgi:hypothetical protein
MDSHYMLRRGVRVEGCKTWSAVRIRGISRELADSVATVWNGVSDSVREALVAERVLRMACAREAETAPIADMEHLERELRKLFGLYVPGAPEEDDDPDPSGGGGGP